MKLPRWHQLSERDRRALLLGLAVLTPALLWTVVVRPYIDALRGARERIAAERALLAREEELIRRGPELPDSIAAVQAEAERLSRRLVQAPNLALAEARVGEHLERVAESSRVLLQEIRSIQPGPRELPAGLEPIRLGVRGESDLNGVATMLYRLETGPLLLRVEALQMEPVMTRPQAARGDRDAPPQEPRPTGVVRFQLVIEAYAPTEPVGAAAVTSEESR